MADLASGDVTYTFVDKEIQKSNFRKNLVTLAFGDGAKTYPAGGVPLLKGKLGCPNTVRELYLIDADASNGFVYKVDLANLKLRIYQGDNNNAADAALIELVGGAATPAAATLKVCAIGW